MSSDNGEASHALTSGLESIALEALQKLQKDQGKNPTENETHMVVSSADVLTRLAMKAPRVVSAEIIKSEDNYVSASPLPPKADVKVEFVKVRKTEGKEVISPMPTASRYPIPEASRSTIPMKVPSASQLTSVQFSRTISDDKHISTKNNQETIKAADFSHILADPEAWLQQTENMFSKLPQVEQSSKEIVVQPNDVLCGRGGETNHHPGNVRYRSLVKAYQKLYLLAKRRDKPKIAQCIVVSVRGVNGRFLKRMKDSKLGGSLVWVDVGNVKAREKTSQALREGAPDLRESVTTSTVTTTASDGEIHVPPERKETTIAPPTVMTPSMATMGTRMGWDLSTGNFNSVDSSGSAKKTTSPANPTPSSLESLDPETHALTTKAFSAAAAELMRHPIFHQLDPAQQQQAILHEFAQAAASVAATRTSTTTITGKKQPFLPVHFKTHEHQYYVAPPHPRNSFGNYYNCYSNGDGSKMQASDISNAKTPEPVSSRENPFPQACRSNDQSSGSVAQSMMSIMRGLETKRKAVASDGNCAAASSADNRDVRGTPSTADDHHNTRKRPAPSPSPSSIVTSMGTVIPSKTPRLNSLSVVSDTGSEESSSSSSASSCSSFVTNSFEPMSISSNSSIKHIDNNRTDVDRGTIASSALRRGSRLKRFKARMDSQFKSLMQEEVK
mmetsp:Transcript_27557/g.64606  ORF Transcript_27557/g.64606 Transcript_27557/m.64606 type:complete len:672 (+) Transcript_27557:462-2477(+)